MTRAWAWHKKTFPNYLQKNTWYFSYQTWFVLGKGSSWLCPRCLLFFFFHNYWNKTKWKSLSIRISEITWPADFVEFPQILYQGSWLGNVLGSNGDAFVSLTLEATLNTWALLQTVLPEVCKFILQVSRHFFLSSVVCMEALLTRRRNPCLVRFSLGVPLCSSSQCLLLPYKSLRDFGLSFELLELSCLCYLGAKCPQKAS